MAVKQQRFAVDALPSNFPLAENVGEKRVGFSGGFVYPRCPSGKAGSVGRCEIYAAFPGLKNSRGGVAQNEVLEVLWRGFFKSPTQWWDNRQEKRSSRHPDFRHKTSQLALWLDNAGKPAWVDSQLAASDAQGGGRIKGWQRAGAVGKRFPGNGNPAASPSSVEQEGRDEVLWQDLFSEPDLWWDNRKEKRSPRHPDFKHKKSKVGLWLDNSHKPAWVDTKLAKLDEVGVGLSGISEGEGSGGLCWEGELVDAVGALEQLVQVKSSVDTSVFSRLLKRCIEERDLVLGSRIHALAVQGGYGSDAFVANHLIRMYTSHGRLEEANQVFSKVPAPDNHTWQSIILAHAQHGQFVEAIGLYRQMRRESSVKPNSYVFVAVLKACAGAADLVTGKDVHADMSESKVEPNVYVGSCLVDMYSKCGSLLDARRVFDSLPAKDVVLWNAMIAAYAQHGLGQEALSLYASMQEDSSMQPNPVTYMCLLKACASIKALEQGKQLHAEVQKKGLQADVLIGSCLVDLYAKCGSLQDARNVFDRMPTRDVVTWNVMISGYAQQEMGREALDLYDCMRQEGIISADHVTYASLLKACASTGAVHEGRKLHLEIQEAGLEADMVVGSCLVDMYAKFGSLEDARRVFDALFTRDVVTWTSIIAGYAQQGRGQDALAVYARMLEDGMTPANNVTIICLLQACASVGALHQGKQLHAQIRERGLESDVVIGSCLVDMYAKCADLDEARRVFDTLSMKDAVTWTALLNGYAEHGDAQVAMEFFKEMLQHGVKLDDAIFTSLLVACSHAGRVTDGQRYFLLMNDYGIMPTVKHYVCMVDLFARSGQLDEAENLLLTMPYESSAAGWTSLLSACKNHGDVVRAKRCFDRLVELEPDNASAYVLLGYTYASAGRWEDVEEIEVLRKAAGAWKKPAKACIEVKNVVHEFTVGESRADISSGLRTMNMKVKDEGGHVPKKELVLKAMSDSEKEDALCGHAEKLALAYGLLNTPDGTPLLVTKNLRMCDDCHSSTKIMSRLEKREIIVRDAHRVHRFIDGSCLCGDRH